MEASEGSFRGFEDLVFYAYGCWYLYLQVSHYCLLGRGEERLIDWLRNSGGVTAFGARIVSSFGYDSLTTIAILVRSLSSLLSLPTC